MPAAMVCASAAPAVDPHALSGVFTKLDKADRLTVVQNSAVYPRPRSVDKDTIRTNLKIVEYDGADIASFREAVARASTSVELKALGAQLAVKEVLGVLAEDDVYVELGVGLVDAVILRVRCRACFLKPEGIPLLPARLLGADVQGEAARVPCQYTCGCAGLFLFCFAFIACWCTILAGVLTGLAGGW